MDNNKKLEKITMKELTEKEEMEIEGGVHQPLSKGLYRVVKRNAGLYDKNNHIHRIDDIAKGEIVKVVTFSDSTGVSIDGSPATLIRYKGNRYYIKAKVIANSFPKQKNGYAELHR